MITEDIKNKLNKLNKFNITEINKKSFDLWKIITNSENIDDDKINAVIFSKNQDDVYVALKFIDFINLMYSDWVPNVKVNKKSVIPLNGCVDEAYKNRN